MGSEADEGKEIKILMRFCNNLIIDQVSIKPFYRTFVNSAYSTWAKNKNVYSFDDAALLEIYSQKVDIPKLYDLLPSMPFKCIYIDTKISIFGPVGDITSHGLWATRRVKIDGCVELVLIILTSETNAYPIIVPISRDDTVEDCVIKSKYSVPNSYFATRITEEVYISKMRGAINSALCLVEYICAVNHIRETFVTVRPEAPKFYLTEEIQDWDLVFRYVQVNSFCQHPIQDNCSTINEAIIKSGAHAVHSTKKPHIRCGHWKHVWCGKRNAPNLRIAKIKWIPETYVNRTKGVPGALPIVIRKDISNNFNI